MGKKPSLDETKQRLLHPSLAHEDGESTVRAPGLSALPSLETLDVVSGESTTVGPTKKP